MSCSDNAEYSHAIDTVVLYTKEKLEVRFNSFMNRLDLHILKFYFYVYHVPEILLHEDSMGLWCSGAFSFNYIRMF